MSSVARRKQTLYINNGGGGGGGRERLGVRLGVRFIAILVRFANDLLVISNTLPIRKVHNLAQPLTYSTTIAIRKSCL